MSNKERRQTAQIADLVVLEAIGTEWTPADQICEQAGIPRPQGRRAAARLAETGALQRREVTCLAAKSRLRSRSEYRRPPEDRDGWQRFPPSIEPQWHPVDCSKARRIAGKSQQLFLEYAPMTDNELFELPRGVRERFQDIPDSAFADHPEVAALRARLDELEAKHSEAAAAHHKLSNQLSGLGEQQEWARAEAVRLADGRPRRLAEILLSGDHDLAQDRAVLAEIANLHHFVAAVDLARPHIEKTIRQASGETGLIVSNMDGARDAYRGLLDQLKLAEAQSLAA